MASLTTITLPARPVGIEGGNNQPRFSIHEVVAGDNLWDIANRHGVSYDKLLEFNLSYNFASLEELNPNLIYWLTLQNGQNLHQVPVKLQPGQTILIPEINDPCHERFVSDTGQPVAMASCAFGNAQEHFDPIYAYNDPRHSMDYYINAKDDEGLQGILARMQATRWLSDVIRDEQTTDIPFSQIEGIAMAQLTGPLGREADNLNCTNTDITCYRRRTMLWSTVGQRQEWIAKNIRQYDLDKNGRFSEQELSHAIIACETRHPVEE